MSNEAPCLNCDYNGPSLYVDPIDEDLRKTWDLSPRLTELFNLREGKLCHNCGVNVRAQGLAKAILLSSFG